MQSHMCRHPDFCVERMHRSTDDSIKSVRDRLYRVKERVETETGTSVHALTWSFGIYDPGLEHLTWEEGYTAAFTLDAQPLRVSQLAMALLRYLITDGCDTRCMANILNVTRGGNHE